MDCILSSEYDYIIRYHVEKVQPGTISLFAQQEAQGVPANEELYADGSRLKITVVNCLYYNYSISLLAKVYLVFISLVLIQKEISCINFRIVKNESRVKKMSSGAGK